VKHPRAADVDFAKQRLGLEGQLDRRENRRSRARRRSEATIQAENLRSGAARRVTPVARRHGVVPHGRSVLYCVTP
jgi:hypothetical protein